MQNNGVPSQWIRTEQDARAIAAGCWWDERRGAHVVQFCADYLRHFEGEFAGKPFILLDWQVNDLVMPLFCWTRPDGTRRFRKAGVWVSKKNGKTTMCAAFTLIGVFGDGEPGAEVYAAAVSRDQSSMIYRKAEMMAKASPDLNRVLMFNPSKKRFYHPDSGSFFQALSADANVAEGLNSSFLIKDELHAWKTGPGRRLDSVLRFAGTSRRQPLQIEISTAGDDEDSLGFEAYQYAKNVRDDVVEDWTFLPVIYEMDAEGNIADERQWAKANPSLGHTMTLERFREDYKQATSTGGAALQDFRRYRLGRWVTKTAQWIEPDKWRACTHHIDPDTLKGQWCCGGLDLALVDDSTAFVLCFNINGVFCFKTWLFLPEQVAEEKERQDRGAKYTEWAGKGHYILTPGNVTDFGVVKQTILDAHEQYNIREIAFDPYRAQQITQDLGAEGVNMSEFRQTFLHMSEPCMTFERAVESREIEHFNHPALKWQVCNAKTVSDTSGNIKLDKRISRQKIDAAVAAVMAFARERMGTESGSVYDDDAESLIL